MEAGSAAERLTGDGLVRGKKELVQAMHELYDWVTMAPAPTTDKEQKALSGADGPRQRRIAARELLELWSGEESREAAYAIWERRRIGRPERIAALASYRLLRG